MTAEELLNTSIPDKRTELVPRLASYRSKGVFSPRAAVR